MASKARLAIQLSLDGASQTARGLGMVAGGVGAIKRGVSSAAQDMFHFVQLGKDAFNMSRRLASGAITAADALLAPNEQFEVSEVAFTQLLGSAEAAKERIQDLYTYANNTPFLNPDVVRGGKILEAFGGAAIGTGKGLEMTGDMAAYASTEMSEVAMWVGRAYSAIQSGKPFGEAAARLQDLTLLTGTERNLLEDMNKKGASANEIWAKFTEIMEKVSGAAKRQSDTFRGAKSTIQGLWGEVKRLTGVRLFENVKADVMGLRDEMSGAFDAGRIQKFADKAGDIISKMYDQLKDKGLGGVGAGLLLDAAEQGKLEEVLLTIVKGAGQNFGVAIHNAALKYGPDIQRAMIPKKLHGTLGLDKNRNAAIQYIAAGGNYRDVMGDLSLKDKTQITMAHMFSGGAPNPNAARSTAQVWAQQQNAGPGKMLPFVDIAKEVAKVGVEATKPGPKEVYTEGKEMIATLHEINVQLGNTEKATRTLADRMLDLSARF